MPAKRKRSSKSNPLPTELLSSLESSDRRAAKLHKSQSSITTPRSHAAKSQVDIQTVLIECRILMQQALTSLPVSQNLQNTTDEDDSDDENKDSSANGLDEMLTTLLNARRQLCVIDESSCDNETDSDSDPEDRPSQNLKLSTEYSKLRNNWKTTLNKHYANIHLQNQQNKNKFQVVDQSFWTQIQSNVKHSALLDTTNMNKTQEDFDNTHIGHDDSKLYQNMLKEYISNSAERGKDGAATAAAERLKRSMKNGKSKKDVDRRASKGRKIRYIVHEKLQNFTFPVNRSAAMGAMDEGVLFKSMLGGAGR